MEAFSYEDFSRSYWTMIRGSVSDYRNTSIITRLWRAYNIQEDENRKDDASWEQTKVIAGSMSKKAFDQIVSEAEY